MTAPDPGAEVLVPPPDNGVPIARENIFPDARTWFEMYFSPLWARPGGYNWCHQWYEHEEAKLVISLLWESWELAWDDGHANTKMVWLRDFAYNLMEKLTAEKSCFDGCDWNADEPRHKPKARPLA